MIAATEIGKLIVNPDLAGTYSASDLKEIRDKFSYCSTLHLLYLKNISLTSDLDFEIKLRYSAAHIMDRERMYFLIHSKTEKNSKASLLEEKTSAETTDEKPVFQIESIENTASFTENPEMKSETQHSESIQELLEAAPDLSAIAYSEELVSENQSEESETYTTSFVEEIIAKDDLTNTTADKTSEPKNETSSMETAIDISNLSFIDWLRYKQTGKLAKTTEEVKQAGTGEKSEEKPEIQKTTSIATETGSKIKKTGLSRADVDALLNKFIAEEPRISKPQATFFNPVKSAKQSLEESTELVTETLAKIYHLQKNYAKAIQAYEQLSLVFPEKKTFFASRIEKIKEEQNKEK